MAVDGLSRAVDGVKGKLASLVAFGDPCPPARPRARGN